MIESCHVLTAGTCRHLERVVVRTGRWRPIEMPSLFGVIAHPTEGLVLFDTGWSPWVDEVTRDLPLALYRLIVPFRVDATTSARGRLEAMGYAADDVRHVICSHFHADHIGGLPDFPKAAVHASKAGWEHVSSGRRLGLWRRGYFPELIADDVGSRGNWIGELRDDGWGPFPNTHDLFGDGTLRLIDLGGHAPGQLGLLVALPSGATALFAADAAWTTRSITDEAGPSRLAQRAIFDDRAAYRATLARLHVAMGDPMVRVVPAHCPDAPRGLLA